MDKLAKRVAARWSWASATREWQPEIPSWVFQRFASKVAYSSSSEDIQTLSLAKESVNLTIPRFLDALRTVMGARFSPNASQRRADIYYYFASKETDDSIAMHLNVRGGQVSLDLAYVPSGENGLDYTKTKQVQTRIPDPEMAGLYLMRMVKALFRAMS